MRYDAQEHLDAFRTRGAFPAIHDDVATLFAEESVASRVCDLCCNTGLLGERLRRAFGVDVVGIDGDADAVRRGTEAGVGYDRLVVHLDASTLDAALAWLAERRIDGVVARRCLSELLIDPDLRARLPAGLARIGVRELVIQGRAPVAGAVHPFPSVAEELAALCPPWRVVRRVGPCAVLRCGA
mgnify:CR=1 FL=1